MLELTSLLGWRLGLFLVLLPFVYILNRFVLRGGNHHYVFAYVMGSAIAATTFFFVLSLSSAALKQNPFIVGVWMVIIVGLWKFLFGPWGSEVRATVLGTFIFWIIVHKVSGQTPDEQFAMLLASIIALIPAVIWCRMFLAQHRERLSVVVLTFLAGMLSTAPILFYDYVVRKGLELHFFLVKITPEHFMRVSETFARQAFTGQRGVVTTSLAATIVSFTLVALIEEWSKNWVMRKSDRAFFRSIDDCIQLAIIAAIGFAFAENIVNPNYFIGFVRYYLIDPERAQWGTFLASVVGRAVITNMVHVTASGVLGYYYGLAFFALPYLEQQRARGRRRSLLTWLHKALRVGRVQIFRDSVLAKGMLWAVVIHGMFNILTSITDVLPGNPETIGELFNYTGPLSSLSIIALPAMFYVFGGWFLLKMLFKKKDDLRDFGQRIEHEAYVEDALV